jgi:tetratricopeptide (TPR) repeat protein
MHVWEGGDHRVHESVDTGGDAGALLNRGRAYVEKGMWREAKADLDRSIGLDGRSAEAFYHRGRADAGSGRLIDAAGDFTASLMLKPDATAPYISRAELLARGGIWDAAARDAIRPSHGSRTPGPIHSLPGIPRDGRLRVARRISRERRMLHPAMPSFSVTPERPIGKRASLKRLSPHMTRL